MYNKFRYEVSFKAMKVIVYDILQLTIPFLLKL